MMLHSSGNLQVNFMVCKLHLNKVVFKEDAPIRESKSVCLFANELKAMLYNQT